MANSFGDQFLKAGLVSKEQLNKATKSRNKQQKLKHKQKVEVVDEAAEAARQVAAEKAAHDRELNRLQKEAVEQKAVQAQVRQLIEMNRVSRDDGETSYNFQDGSAIKNLFVTKDIHGKLGRGVLAIVRLGSGYEIIPSVVAEKIRLRDESCIVSNAVSQQESGDDGLYADYKVPDDLMW